MSIGLMYISEVFKNFQNAKNIRVDEKNYQKFYEKYPGRLMRIVQELDSQQQSSLSLIHEIVFNVIQIRRKGVVSNRLLHHIVSLGFESSQSLIDFLDRMNRANLHRGEFDSIEKMVKIYIDSLELSTRPAISQPDITHVIL